MLKAMIETLRAKQWTKNVVLFAGLIFDGQLLNFLAFGRVLFAFGLFSLISGAVYTINDLLDISADQMHPIKKFRPIASGRLPKSYALLMAGGLFAITVPAAFWLNRDFGWICLAYVLLMLAYSKWLKKILIIDVMVIALGFVFRVAAGVTVITVQFFSPWLFVLTTLLALFLGFGKRLSEIHLLEGEAGNHRKVLEGYTEPLLNQFLTIVVSGILITYCLYTFNAHPNGESYVMMWTIPFVIFGLFRYLHILQMSNNASSPEEVLLNDRPLGVTVLLWGLAAMTILYFLR